MFLLLGDSFYIMLNSIRVEHSFHWGRFHNIILSILIDGWDGQAGILRHDKNRQEEKLNNLAPKLRLGALKAEALLP
jgi:hypothetical protein